MECWLRLGIREFFLDKAGIPKLVWPVVSFSPSGFFSGGVPALIPQFRPSQSGEFYLSLQVPRGLSTKATRWY
jgi:hypothetical protein